VQAPPLSAGEYEIYFKNDEENYMRYIHKSGLKTAIGSMSMMVMSLCGLQAVAHDGDDNKTDSARHLQGDYGLNAQYSCVRTPFQPPSAHGFDRVTGQLLSGASVAHAAGAGVMSFSKDGTVSVDLTGIELDASKVQPGDVPVSPGIQYGCTGTYSFTSDGRISLSFPSCNVTPPRPGLTVTVGPLELTGFVGHEKDAMVLSEVKGNVETVAVSAGATVLSQRERICTGTFSLDKIGNGD